MRNYILNFLAVFIAFALYNCESLDFKYDQEAQIESSRIEEFIENNNLNMNKLESGLFYMETKTGNGASPDQGDFIMYDYTIRLLDSTLISTTDSVLAKLENQYDSSIIYGTDKKKIDRLIQGEYEALTRLKENGAATIIVPFELGYGMYSFNKIPAYSTLLIDLQLKEVIKDPVQHEKDLLDAYLKNHTEFTKVADGVFYSQLLKGDGNIILNKYPDHEVDFNYSIHLLDGRHILSQKLTVNKETVLMNGLEVGIQQMSVGEKGVLLLNSENAFGTNEQLLIPAYTSILVKIEILSAK